MTPDPFVEEVRALRDELAKEYDYDVDAIFIALRQMEATSGRDHVSLPARRAPEPSDSNSDKVSAQQAAAADGASRRR